MAAAYVPDFGDIIWMDFDPSAGHEQAGHRPALVLSPRRYNRRTRLLVCVLITSQVKGYPFEVRLRHPSVRGVALSDQVKSFDWRKRNARKNGKASPAVVDEVREKIKSLMQLP